MRSRASPTRSARWSSRTTGRSTTGCIEQPAGAVAAAPDRVRPPQPHLHGAVQAQAAPAGRTRATCAAGTIRACRRSPACAGAAAAGGDPRLLRARSASRKPTAWSTSALLEHCVRDVLNRTRAARDGGAAAAQGGDRELSRRARPRSWTRSTTPRIRPPARRKVPFARELYIERDDFMEDPPKKFFRLAPGREVRLRYAYFITCTRGGQGRRRRGRRAALHLRPGDPRRRCAGRPQGRRRRCTGSRPRTRCRPRCGSTTALFTATRPGRRRRFPRDLNPELAGGARRCQARAEPGRGGAGQPLPVRAPRLLLRWIRTPGPERWCSTAPSPCATAGPGCRPKNARQAP